MAKKKTALYFTTVCAFPRNAAVLGGHLVIQEDDPEGTRLMVLNNGKWTHLGDVMEVVYATALRRPPGEKHALGVLGRDGLYREFIFGATSRDIPIPKSEAGYLEDLCNVNERMYICGAQGQVYRLDGTTWRAIDRGLRLKFDGEEVRRMLLSIAGFAEDHLYVCGFGGEVWRFNGKKWVELDSPTNLQLNRVMCGPGQRVYFSGAAGTLFALEPDGSWHDLGDRKVSKAMFSDMTVFQERVYIAAGDGLLYLEGDQLKSVTGPLEGEPEFLAIDAADDRIWCVGAEEVFNYDGQAWTRHLCPENG
jgi:hypothetical protein